MADLPSVSDSVSLPHSPSSQPQSTRIHFPDRFLTTRAHGESSRSSSVSFTSPPNTKLPFQTGLDSRAVVDLTESRRRVRSLGPHPTTRTNSMSKNASPQQHGSRRKKNFSQIQSSALSPSRLDPFMSDFEPSAFSDEYDLSHEDPKILQDVQRALHLQSRRRERMSQQFHPVSDEVPPAVDPAVNTSASHASTSAASPAVQSSPQYLQALNLPSDVDFSPSTRSVPLHPVPLSSNGGATLDWTGSQSEDERLDRRWSISRAKRKSRDKLLPSSKAVVEKQEALFTDKISRIRAEASPPTVRKAAIVSEQLGRRYNVLYNSIASGDPVNLAQVARWYAGSGTETRAWLDSAEPLTWLKHLLDRRGKRRSEWHVSALVVEEHVKSKKGIASSTPPPLTPVATSSLETPPSQSQLRSTRRYTPAPPSDSSPGTSLSRVRSSDGHVSFSPLVENSRDSINNSQTRIDGKARGWRHSIPTFFDSGSAGGTPSPYHYRNTSGGLSPASSRINFPDIIHRFRRHPTESEEGSSSPFGSQSEDQNDLPFTKRRRRNKRKDHPPLSELPSPLESGTELNVPSEFPDPHDLTPLPIGSTSSPVFPSDPEPEPEAVVDQEDDQPDPPLSQPTPNVHSNRSHRSSSLPISPSTADPVPLESKSDPDEEQLEREYELKLRALDELKNHNHRLRHRMQRVATDVREYDLVCSTVMPTLGVAYRSLPMELLDALNHDPSAVTSGTRRRHGWRVVEDIHVRVLRQRKIIKSFLSTVKAEAEMVDVPEELLDKPISNLMEKLQALEKEREPLQEQADRVSRMLMEVKASHATVKQEYNDSLSYTSVVYPELSHIVALEERYKDQYQQVWELGMDALTFILDTVTPFWRNYGKTIGEDIQDFMIIPWYRNEFTGEPKRYPVQSLPCRSLRHWVALFCLSTSTFVVTLLQARAAIMSTWHYRLLWIDNQGFRWAIMPFFWVAILIQWFAVVFEICVVLLQLAVVAWWLGWFIGICT